ncbi:MAG TPA: hypothetical protein VM736_07120 [Gemmatimonadales bacterium]|nr:hypothetical protein [Gemmatimonadales bacterium]
MFTPRRFWWGLVATALVAGACRSTTGPQAQLANPAQLSSNLQAVAGVVSSPTFQSFGAIRTSAGSPVAVSTPAGALLNAAPLIAPQSAQPYAGAPARPEALRTAASTLGSRIEANVIPSTLLGKTFVWDTTSHAYVQAASSTAPSNGVRIILYTVDAGGVIVEHPLTAVGYVDLLDLSTTSTNTLRVTVYGGTPASPGTAYADYTVSGTVTGSPTPTAFNATATGYVTDGTHKLTFNASFSATGLNTSTPGAQVDVIWDLNTPAVHIELHETLTSDATQVTITLHFSETSGGEAVSVDGSVSVVKATGAVTVNLSITVNGTPYATVSGMGSNIQFQHADHSALSPAELQALGSLWSLPDTLEAAIEDLFHPCQRLMGA